MFASALTPRGPSGSAPFNTNTSPTRRLGVTQAHTKEPSGANLCDRLAKHEKEICAAMPLASAARIRGRRCAIRWGHLGRRPSRIAPHDAQRWAAIFAPGPEEGSSPAKAATREALLFSRPWG
eukprot:1128412-Pyramimonas_sp.AAC.1